MKYSDLRSISVGIISLFLVVTLFTSAHATSLPASCLAITKTIGVGSSDQKTNGQVTLLQQFLSSKGYLLVTPNGYYGQATKKAVQRFQKDNNIYASGMVSSYTRALIKQITCTQSSSANDPEISIGNITGNTATFYVQSQNNTASTSISFGDNTWSGIPDNEIQTDDGLFVKKTYTHTYTQPGTYTVQLWLHNTCSPSKGAACAAWADRILQQISVTLPAQSTSTLISPPLPRVSLQASKTVLSSTEPLTLNWFVPSLNNETTLYTVVIDGNPFSSTQSTSWTGTTASVELTSGTHTIVVSASRPSAPSNPITISIQPPVSSSTFSLPTPTLSLSKAILTPGEQFTASWTTPTGYTGVTTHLLQVDGTKLYENTSPNYTDKPHLANIKPGNHTLRVKTKISGDCNPGPMSGLLPGQCTPPVNESAWSNSVTMTVIASTTQNCPFPEGTNFTAPPAGCTVTYVYDATAGCKKPTMTCTNATTTSSTITIPTPKVNALRFLDGTASNTESVLVQVISTTTSQTINGIYYTRNNIIKIDSKEYHLGQATLKSGSAESFGLLTGVHTVTGKVTLTPASFSLPTIESAWSNPVTITLTGVLPEPTFSHTVLQNKKVHFTVSGALPELDSNNQMKYYVDLGEALPTNPSLQSWSCTSSGAAKTCTQIRTYLQPGIYMAKLYKNNNYCPPTIYCTLSINEPTLIKNIVVRIDPDPLLPTPTLSLSKTILTPGEQFTASWTASTGATNPLYVLKIDSKEYPATTATQITGTPFAQNLSVGRHTFQVKAKVIPSDTVTPDCPVNGCTPTESPWSSPVSMTVVASTTQNCPLIGGTLLTPPTGCSISYVYDATSGCKKATTVCIATSSSTVTVATPTVWAYQNPTTKDVLVIVTSTTTSQTINGVTYTRNNIIKIDSTEYQLGQASLKTGSPQSLNLTVGTHTAYSKISLVPSDPSLPTIESAWSTPYTFTVAVTALSQAVTNVNTLITQGVQNVTQRVVGGTKTYAASTACTDIKTNLHRGNETAAVKALQEFLINQGLLNEKASGFFGDLTIEAVKRYQRSLGLKETGMVYEVTREAIKNETCGGA